MRVSVENDASHVVLLASKVAATAKSRYTQRKAVYIGYDNLHVSNTQVFIQFKFSGNERFGHCHFASLLDMCVESAFRPISCAKGLIFSGSKNHSLSGHKLTIAESTPVLFSPKRAFISPMQLSSIPKSMRLCKTDSLLASSEWPTEDNTTEFEGAAGGLRHRLSCGTITSSTVISLPNSAVKDETFHLFSREVLSVFV